MEREPNTAAIIQALRSCTRHQCATCLYQGQGIACKKKLMEDAAAELERKEATQ